MSTSPQSVRTRGRVSRRRRVEILTLIGGLPLLFALLALSVQLIEYRPRVEVAEATRSTPPVPTQRVAVTAADIAVLQFRPPGEALHPSEYLRSGSDGSAKRARAQAMPMQASAQAEASSDR